MHHRDLKFTSSINWLVVWEQRGSNHSSLTHSYQVAAPLQCISLKQNLHLKSWMLIKNSLTNYFLGVHINHQYRYMCAGVPIDSDIFYGIHRHAPLSSPKSANRCSKDPNHAITIPSNLTPAFVSSLADSFSSFLFACWAWICCTKWEIHNPISQTNSRPLWINTMLLHKRSLLMNSKTSKGANLFWSWINCVGQNVTLKYFQTYVTYVFLICGSGIIFFFTFL